MMGCLLSYLKYFFIAFLFSWISPTLAPTQQEGSLMRDTFTGIKALDNSRLGFLYGLSEKEAIKILSKALPNKKLKDRANAYLSQIIKISAHYQVDPLWVVAVIWTESHFDPHAKSPVEAYGLMQVMPSTGNYLLEKMEKKKELKHPLLSKKKKQSFKDPEINIVLGVYYLKKLLTLFKGNYFLSTVAYNEGPSRVRRLWAQGRITSRHLYWRNVSRRYKLLRKSFMESEKEKLSQTYISQSKGISRSITF